MKDNTIISTGYNGGARGGTNCIDAGVCLREQLKVPAGERYELCVAVHAEANAIINAPAESMKGATIYISGEECNDDPLSKFFIGTPANCSPCLMCQRMIANAGIEKVIYTGKSGVLRILAKKDLQIFALGGV